MPQAGSEAGRPSSVSRVDPFSAGIGDTASRTERANTFILDVGQFLDGGQGELGRPGPIGAEAQIALVGEPAAIQVEVILTREIQALGLGRAGVGEIDLGIERRGNRTGIGIAIDCLTIDTVGGLQRGVAEVQRVGEATAQLCDGAVDADAEPVDAERQAR